MALDIADQLAITDLVHRYCHTADHGPWQAMRDFFTTDGVFEVPARGFDFRGMDALMAFFESRSSGPSVGRHVTSNLVIEGGGNEARAMSYLQILSAEGSPRAILMFGRYQDKLRRTPEGWRFSHRRVEME
jgi:SnoaL-like domain